MDPIDGIAYDQEEAEYAAADVAADVDCELADMVDQLGADTVAADPLHYRRLAALRVFADRRQEQEQPAAA